MTARDIFLQAAAPSEAALPPGCRTCEHRGIIARGGSTEYWGCRSAGPCPVLMAQGEIPQCFRMRDLAGVSDRPEDLLPVGDLPAGTPDATALAVRLIEVAAYARMIEESVEGEEVGYGEKG